jgi:superoxide dismutase
VITTKVKTAIFNDPTLKVNEINVETFKGVVQLSGFVRSQELAVEDLLHRLDQVPEPIRTAVRNNGGGHLNHQFFWDILGPRASGAPKGAIADAIKRDFGSFEQFQSLFTEAATKQFGSGWAFLRREPLGAPPRDRVATQPGQRAGARDAGAPLLRCLGARLLPEVQEPPP